MSALEDETPHYYGHRDRLRARFGEVGRRCAARLRIARTGAVPLDPAPRTSSRWPRSLIRRFGGFAETITASRKTARRDPRPR